MTTAAIMTPSYSTKNGVRYRFYVSSALLRGRKARAGSGKRVPAEEIENAVRATRPDYWMAKFARNTARNARVRQELRAAGWRVLVLWECEINNTIKLSAQLKRFFGRHAVAVHK